ncbi:hypothetical protein L914_05002 [Phytophthora nicotianae]|uniref:Uncharacterized protein n=2 Tax=Phytophthora nicotianae TaxID=4792 RepID=V9FM25_PHYNI|nr:hypothetical protein F443_05189 [Phytophthora nicotianae P1569]ETM51069.1 hypothetical protein L914_05002 [Phytophthora nicotianae]
MKLEPENGKDQFKMIAKKQKWIEDSQNYLAQHKKYV